MLNQARIDDWLEEAKNRILEEFRRREMLTAPRTNEAMERRLARLDEHAERISDDLKILGKYANDAWWRVPPEIKRKLARQRVPAAQPIIKKQNSLSQNRDLSRSHFSCQRRKEKCP